MQPLDREYSNVLLCLETLSQSNSQKYIQERRPGSSDQRGIQRVEGKGQM